MTDYADMSLREELETRFADAERRRQEEEFLSRGWQPPAGWQRVGQGLKHDLEDIGYGMKKALSGATLGASDWALRKLGVTDDDYLAQREAEGLGNYVKGAGFVSELGGNMLGAGGAIVKGAGKLGFKGLKQAVASGATEGAAYGLTGSDSLSEVPQNVATGAGFGAAMPVGLHGVGYAGRKLATPFSSRLMTAGMKGGLDNVSSNPYAVKILKQGLRNNDDVAQKYLERVLPATRNINRETAGMVDNALTSRINVPETIAAERARYGDYMAKHGADEVLNFAPTREQIINYPAESKFNLPKRKLTKEEAEDVLFKKANSSGIEVSGNPLHYTKKGDRGQYVRTLSNTLENPDIKYTMDVKNSHGDIVKRQYFAKKYNGVSKDGNGPFFDFIVKEDDKLYNKFKPENLSYIDNQLQRNPQDVSLSGRLMGAEPTHGLPISYTNNIPQNNIVVNSKLPHISSLYDGLTEFQGKSLKNAIKTGISKTNAKAGSLESLNKVKQEINEAISKAQSTDKPSEVWQLQELKGRFDNAMPQGLKDVDAGFARAKQLENAFERGTHYNPNNVSGADMIAGLSADEQNAVTQGMFKQMTNNSLSGKSLADDVLKYENTLSQVLPETIYNPLMQNLNRQSTRFGRLSELGRAAENRLRSPEGTRFFGREQLESRGSMIGSSLDRANSLLRGRAIRNASNNLMNPEFVGAPVESRFVGNPNLSAALSAEAVNNYNNWQDIGNGVLFL